MSPIVAKHQTATHRWSGGFIESLNNLTSETNIPYFCSCGDNDASIAVDHRIHHIPDAALLADTAALGHYVSAFMFYPVYIFDYMRHRPMHGILGLMGISLLVSSHLSMVKLVASRKLIWLAAANGFLFTYFGVLLMYVLATA